MDLSVYSAIVKEASDIKDGRILDIGCGTMALGIIFKKLGYEVYGVDFWTEPFEIAKEYQLIFHKCNVEVDLLPFEDNFFDIVILAEVIEHFLHSPLFPLGEIHRVLKNSGFLIITAPNVHSLNNRFKFLKGKNIYPSLSDYLVPDLSYKEKSFYDRHNREYTIKELRELIEKAKFKVKKVYFLPSKRIPKNFTDYLEYPFACLRDLIPSFRKHILLKAEKE